MKVVYFLFFFEFGYLYTLLASLRGIPIVYYFLLIICCGVAFVFEIFKTAKASFDYILALSEHFEHYSHRKADLRV